MRISTRDSQETNPAIGTVKAALDLGPPDYNTSTLNHLAMLPPYPIPQRTPEHRDIHCKVIGMYYPLICFDLIYYPLDMYLTIIQERYTGVRQISAGLLVTVTSLMDH